MQLKLERFKNDLSAQKSCQKCGTDIAQKLCQFTLQISSLVDFNLKLQELLPKLYCVNCKVECCLLCGDIYDVQSDEESITGDSGDDVFLANDAFDQVQDLENRLFHCQETQAFVVYLILLQLEMLVSQDSSLANERSQRISRAIKKPKTIVDALRGNSQSGVGYIPNRVDISRDQKSWKLDTHISRSFVDNSIIPFVDLLRKYLPDLERQANTADLIPHESFNAIIQASVLGPLVKRLFKSASIQDLIEHDKLFFSFSKLIQALAVHSETKCFVTEPLCADPGLLYFCQNGKVNLEFGIDTIQRLVQDLSTQASVYNEKLSSDDPVSRITKEIQKLSQKVGMAVQEDSGVVLNDNDYPGFTSKACDLEMPLPSEVLVSRYCSKLREIAFQETDFQIASLSPPKASSSSHVQANLQDPVRLKTIAKELAVLSTSLPIDYCTSAFIRISSMRFDAFLLGLIGPEETPYANGLFLFEVHFPSQYPQVPPELKFLTTNSGHWRANPNLYDNGKVSLSLLNTWATPQWIPGQSTLLQVIISIQSMIFVQRPYFNEPGYGDPVDSQPSLAYSAAVREGVVKNAMIAHLKSLKSCPSGPFADVIRTHFKMKKDRILAQVEKWKSYQTNKIQFVNLCDSLAEELKNL